MERVSSSIFTTKIIEPVRRYESFKESIGVVFDVSRPEKVGPDFFAKIHSRVLGETLLVDCITAAQTFERSPGLIAKDGVDHFLVQAFRVGHTRRCGGKESIGRRGNVIIIDAAQPWLALNSDFYNHTFVVPRRVLAGALIHENDHHGRVIGTENPLGSALLNFILTLPDALYKMTPQEAAETSKLGVDILIAALNQASHAEVVNPEKASVEKRILSAGVRSYLDSHIGDSKLSMTSLMDRFRLSSAKLDEMFEAEGGIDTYIRTRRFHLAHQWLSEDASLRSETIKAKDLRQWEQWFLGL